MCIGEFTLATAPKNEGYMSFSQALRVESPGSAIHRLLTLHVKGTHDPTAAPAPGRCWGKGHAAFPFTLTKLNPSRAWCADPGVAVRLRLLCSGRLRASAVLCTVGCAEAAAAAASKEGGPGARLRPRCSTILGLRGFSTWALKVCNDHVLRFEVS